MLRCARDKFQFDPTILQNRSLGSTFQACPPCGGHAKCVAIEPRSPGSPGTVPRAIDRASAVPVEGDRDALSQVLLNLLSNAGKYGNGPDGPREITVTLEPGPPVRLRVSDRGPGVPRGQERRIFEKFQRAHNSLASGTAGSGLGLTIARTLVEAHGGSLDYAERGGGGAEFTVTFAAVAAPKLRQAAVVSN